MQKEEFLSTFYRCLKKSTLEETVRLSSDFDEDSDIFIDDDACLYISGIKSPYSLDSVQGIKYERDDDYYKVAIHMKNGDAISFYMTGLKHVAIRYSSKVFCDDDMEAVLRALINKDKFAINKDDLLVYLGKESVVNIPEGIRFLGSYAFEGSNVTEVYLPSTVRTIGISCFSGALDLKK